jgi:hypothetical protein
MHGNFDIRGRTVLIYRGFRRCEAGFFRGQGVFLGIFRDFAYVFSLFLKKLNKNKKK